jgi:hypothetical protein
VVSFTLRKLAKLDLSGCTNITNQGVQSLAGLSELATLDIHECPEVTDGAVEYFRSLKCLINRNGRSRDVIQTSEGKSLVKSLVGSLSLDPRSRDLVFTQDAPHGEEISLGRTYQQISAPNGDLIWIQAGLKGGAPDQVPSEGSTSSDSSRPAVVPPLSDSATPAERVQYNLDQSQLYRDVAVAALGNQDLALGEPGQQPQVVHYRDASGGVGTVRQSYDTKTGQGTYERWYTDKDGQVTVEKD